MFLLKGHEDLRQDERVMQLFGLVNTLLSNDPETFKRHLRSVGVGWGVGCGVGCGVGWGGVGWGVGGVHVVYIDEVDLTPCTGVFLWLTFSNTPYLSPSSPSPSPLSLPPPLTLISPSLTALSATQ